MTAAMLLEFAWKSGLLAGAALFGAALLRARPAAERVVVLRLGVVMIVTLPVFALLMPALRLDVPGLAAPAGGTIPAIAGVLAPSRPDAVAASPVSPPVASPVAAAVPPAPAPRPAAPAWRIDAGPVAVAVWALGAALLLFRLGAGVAALHRWTRRAEPVRDPRWLSALDRAAPDGARPVLRASSRVSSPLSWGVRPAVILLNADALGQAGRADAILTHEMGHVRHGDWLFLMLARLLVALLWFNPLVWLLHRELAHQSEQAADAWAVRRIDRADYATALVAMAARRRPHAALGMAAPKGELARRVTAIMTGSTGRGRPWPTALAIAGCVGLATPLAAFEPGAAAVAPVLELVAPKARPAVGPATPAPVVSAAPLAAAAPRPLGLAPAAGQGSPVLEHSGQGPVEMEAGAVQMEDHARGMRALAAGLPDPADRANLLAEADELDREAAQLRAESRTLAEELRTVGPAANIAANQASLALNVSTAAGNAAALQVNANFNLRAPDAAPPPPDTARQHGQGAADMRAAARRMRQTATGMDTAASRAERPPGRRTPSGLISEMRGQAAELRRQADNLDAQASQTEAPT
ncbi:M56 family metallopeptidase [Brevundimonas sp.]|uniref:M56 family metallopeptidase n=1 Tax=Brevundimonas sp. TaxID=1871086 RepID=UPI002D58140D|nr:M56 family metallopeptidase [Brevundimonas sp.]HYC96564.1 M56 family metallopeptidase [Brevundimonas sp.]